MSTLSTFALRLSTLFKTWWGAVAALLLVAGGVAAGAVTFLAGRAQDVQLAFYGAVACLVFVVLIAAFVVPPLVRAARSEVRAVRFPVRLTAGGLLFLLVLVTVALAAWGTASNVLLLIFSVMVSTLFVQWAAARASLRDTGVAVRFPDHIFAREPVAVVASLHNFKRVLPALFVTIETRERDATFGSRGEGERNATKPLSPEARLGSAPRAGRARRERHTIAYFEYVGRKTKAEARAERVFETRGEVRIEGFTLSTVFPFGLFELRRSLRARDVRLVVYPRLEPVRARFNLTSLKRVGSSRSARRGAGTDLYGLRGYKAGDDRRHIDWKATARSRRLTVREFAVDELVRVHVVFDPAPHDTPAAERASRFEYGVTLSASLLAHFTRQNGEVALTILGDSAPAVYGDGDAHLHALLRRLALVAPQDAIAGKAVVSKLAPTNPTPTDEAQTPPLEAIHARTAAEGAHLFIVTAARTPDALPRTAHVVEY